MTALELLGRKIATVIALAFFLGLFMGACGEKARAAHQPVHAGVRR